MASGIGAMALGSALMLDDYKDIGDVICNGCEYIPDSPHPHHWIYGTLLFLGGMMTTCLGGLEILSTELKRRKSKYVR